MMIPKPYFALVLIFPGSLAGRLYHPKNHPGHDGCACVGVG